MEETQLFSLENFIALTIGLLLLIIYILPNDIIESLRRDRNNLYSCIANDIRLSNSLSLVQLSRTQSATVYH